MHQIDIHLAGRRATLGALRWELHQLLERHHAARVEVRYSSQSRAHFDSGRAAKDIAHLLQAHGQAAASVSVRRHPDAQADASGAHLLRVLPSMQQPEPPGPKSGWRAWLLPLLAGWPQRLRGDHRPECIQPEHAGDGTAYPGARSFAEHP